MREDDRQRAAQIDRLRLAMVAASKRKREFRLQPRSTLYDPAHKSKIYLVAQDHRIAFDIVYREFLKLRPNTSAVIVSRLLREMHLHVYRALGYTWIKWDERFQKYLDLSVPTLHTNDGATDWTPIKRTPVTQKTKRTPV